MSQRDETPYNDFHAKTYYARPDTSDKTDEETWSEYWDRKRIERHGTNCQCVICLNADYLRELGKTLLPDEMKEWLD
jgi:hypothetical protein